VIECDPNPCQIADNFTDLYMNNSSDGKKYMMLNNNNNNNS
jgi:hypothetical protein